VEKKIDGAGEREERCRDQVEVSLSMVSWVGTEPEVAGGTLRRAMISMLENREGEERSVERI